MAIAVIGLGGPLFWLAGDLVSVEPDPASREYVEEQLAMASGVAIAVPVDLPPGYEPPGFWGYSSGPDGVARSRQATFFPTEDYGMNDRIQGVQMCMEWPNDDQDNCGHERGNTVERQVDDVRVVIWLSDRNPANRAAWQSVPFTTDLNRVHWLH